MSELPHPSTLGEILDRTVHIYRSRFLAFLGIAALPAGVVLVFAAGIGLLVALAGSAGSRTGYPALTNAVALLVLVPLALVALPAFLAAIALGTAATNHAAAHAFAGEEITIRGACKEAWKRGWRYCWLYLLQALIVWIAPLTVWVALLIFAAVAEAGAVKAGVGASGGALFGLAAILSVFALAGYGLWMLLRLSLAFPACVVEQIGAWPAIKRSSLLCKGTRGRIFLLYMLGAALNWIISISITLPLTILMAALTSSSSPEQSQTASTILVLIVYGGGFFVQMLTRPIYGIALMLFYYDQRIRLEGYDIEWMMQRAGMAAPLPLQPETAHEAAPWLTPAARVEHPAVVLEAVSNLSSEAAPEAMGATNNESPQDHPEEPQ
jgi:hypothetical protein